MLFLNFISHSENGLDVCGVLGVRLQLASQPLDRDGQGVFLHKFRAGRPYSVHKSGPGHRMPPDSPPIPAAASVRTWTGWAGRRRKSPARSEPWQFPAPGSRHPPKEKCDSRSVLVVCCVYLAYGIMCQLFRLPQQGREKGLKIQVS